MEKHNLVGDPGGAPASKWEHHHPTVQLYCPLKVLAGLEGSWLQWSHVRTESTLVRGGYPGGTTSDGQSGRLGDNEYA